MRVINYKKCNKLGVDSKNKEPLTTPTPHDLLVERLIHF
jgi:hypothetical protein